MPYTLPTGKNVESTDFQASAIWALYLAAARDGMGLKIEMIDDGIAVTTIYSPQWCGLALTVGEDSILDGAPSEHGGYAFSEQSAPLPDEISSAVNAALEKGGRGAHFLPAAQAAAKEIKWRE